MKVLIVSFDKTLTEDLKKVLSDHEVYVAKNSEEAIKMIPSDIEGVIYDAISGAISEEDINTLYTKKFSNARYVVLYDELFPVDENNIIVPNKLLVPRDESPKEIVNKLLEFPVEEAAAPTEGIAEENVPEIEEQPVEEVVEGISEEVPELEIETTAYETPTYEEPVQEEVIEESVAGSVEEALQELEATGVEVPEEIEIEEPVVEAEEEKVEISEPEHEVPAAQTEATPGTGKILIVSFDQTLIDSVKAAFGHKHEVESVKTVKQAIEHGRDASVVVFDAISGVIAEKGLIELSNDPAMAGKNYIILVDDLFPINVDGIPLDKKVSVSRDTDPNRIKEIIEEQLASAPAQQVEEAHAEEAPPQQIEETQEVEEIEEIEKIEEVVAPPEEELEPVETLEEMQPEETIETLEVQEEVAQPPAESMEEEHMPALEALEKVMEEQEIEIEESQPIEELVEEVSAETPVEEVPTVAPAGVSISQEELDKFVESAVMKALSEDRIRESVI